MCLLCLLIVLYCAVWWLGGLLPHSQMSWHSVMINIKYLFNIPSLLSVCICVHGCGVVEKHSMLVTYFDAKKYI